MKSDAIRKAAITPRSAPALRPCAGLGVQADYYAALTEAFRPGCAVHALDGLPGAVCGLAARASSGDLAIALLNLGPTQLDLSVAVSGPAVRLRVSPERLPWRPDIITRETGREEQPLTAWEPVAQPGRDATLTLESNELAILRSPAHA